MQKGRVCLYLFKISVTVKHLTYPKPFLLCVQGAEFLGEMWDNVRQGFCVWSGSEHDDVWGLRFTVF